MKKLLSNSLQTGYSCLGKNGQFHQQIPSPFSPHPSGFLIKGTPMPIIAPSARNFAMVMCFAEMEASFVLTFVLTFKGDLDRWLDRIRMWYKAFHFIYGCRRNDIVNVSFPKRRVESAMRQKPFVRFNIYYQIGNNGGHWRAHSRAKKTSLNLFTMALL